MQMDWLRRSKGISVSVDVIALDQDGDEVDEKRVSLTKTEILGLLPTIWKTFDSDCRSCGQERTSRPSPLKKFQVMMRLNTSSLVA